MTQDQHNRDVKLLRSSLGNFPERVVRPVIVLVTGLPGTGKSFFCRKLAEKAALLVLESDDLRKKLFPSPDYSSEESTRLFNACHTLISELLHDGVSVVFDATNLSEKHRERIYNIADKNGARLIVVEVKAPAELVYQRLHDRKMRIDIHNKSDADRKVYERMKNNIERIKRNFLVVDTSRDISPAINKILHMVNH
jgi:predicted kinase